MRTKPLSFFLNLLASGAVVVGLAVAWGWPVRLAYLVALNGWLLALLGKDKLMATHAPRSPAGSPVAFKFRTPESTLLGLAALGGTPALVVGILLFRHKIRKDAFLAPMLAIIALQAVALYVYAPTLVGWF